MSTAGAKQPASQQGVVLGENTGTLRHTAPWASAFASAGASLGVVAQVCIHDDHVVPCNGTSNHFKTKLST